MMDAFICAMSAEISTSQHIISIMFLGHFMFTFGMIQGNGPRAFFLLNLWKSMRRELKLLFGCSKSS